MPGDFLTMERHDADGPLPGDAFARLRSAELDVLQIDGVFAPDLCARMVAALETNAAGFEVTEFPGPFRSFFYGRNLNLNDPELDDYYTAAARFDADLHRFGAGLGVDPVARIAGVLSTLDGGRGVTAAPGPDGAQHFFTTFRGHRNGGYIPPHFDNEQGLRPSYRHVAAVTSGDILSFVVTLAEAEAGGVLELYDLVAAEGRGIINDDDRAQRPDLSTLRSQTVPVPAGSMLVVQSGRRLHRVQPVIGDKMRWTMCSFMALSRDGQRTFAWG